MKSRPTSNYSSTYSSAKKDSLITGLGASHKPTTTLLRPQSSEIAKKLETTKKLLKGPDVSVSSKLVSNISQDIQSKLGLNKFTKEPSRTIGGTVLSTSIKSVGQYRHSSTLDTNNSSKAAGRLTDLFGDFEKKLDSKPKQTSLTDALDKIKQAQRLSSKDGVPPQHPRIRPTTTTFSNRKYSEVKNSSLYNIYNSHKSGDKRTSLLDQMRGVGSVKTESKYTGIQDLDQYKQYSKKRSEQLTRDKKFESVSDGNKQLTFSENGDAQLESELQDGQQEPQELRTEDGSELEKALEEHNAEEAADLENLEIAIQTEIKIPQVTKDSSKKGLKAGPKTLTSPVDVRPGQSHTPAHGLSSLEELKQEISRLRAENTQLKKDMGTERALMTQQMKQLEDERRKLELLRTEASAEMECAKTEWSKIKTSQQELEAKLREVGERDQALTAQSLRLQADLQAFDERKESEIKHSDVKIEFNLQQAFQMPAATQLFDSGVELEADLPKKDVLQSSDPFDTAFGDEGGFKFDFVGGAAANTQQFGGIDGGFGAFDAGFSKGFFEEEAGKKKNTIFESMIDGPSELPKLGDYTSVSPYDEKARNELDAALRKDPTDFSPKATQIVQADSFILDEDGNDPNEIAGKADTEVGQANLTNVELAKLKTSLEQAEKAKQRREAECATLNARVLSLEGELKKISQVVTTLSCHNSSLQNLVYQIGREKANMREKLVALKSTTNTGVTSNDDGFKPSSETQNLRNSETIKSAATGENQTARQTGFFEEHDFALETEPKNPTSSSS